MAMSIYSSVRNPNSGRLMPVYKPWLLLQNGTWMTFKKLNETGTTKKVQSLVLKTEKNIIGLWKAMNYVIMLIACDEQKVKKEIKIMLGENQKRTLTCKTGYSQWETPISEENNWRKTIDKYLTGNIQLFVETRRCKLLLEENLEWSGVKHRSNTKTLLLQRYTQDIWHWWW